MKTWLVGGLAGIAALAVLAVADSASATTTCHATGNWCQGYAHVSTTTGGVGSALRCFALRTTNAAPTCGAGGITPVNEATWEADAGGCVTFYYFDTTTSGVPPAAPNKVTIRVYSGATSNIVKEFLNAGAEPSNGQSFAFCATSDGNVGSSPRAGTYHLYVQAVKDNGVGGVGNYNIASNGVATVGVVTAFDQGALRGRLIVSSLTRSSYPSGSTFAYGASGDETNTETATFSQPNVDENVECLGTGMVDAATRTIGAAGAVVDVDATTTLAQLYDIDQTFPAANSPYVGTLAISCTNPFTSLPWTIFAPSGHGASIVRLGDSLVYDSGSFNVNPDIRFDSDGTGTFDTADDDWIVKLGSSSGPVVPVFNKGEVYYFEGYAFNARSQKLIRTMQHAFEDATPTTCSSIPRSPNIAGLYSGTATVSTTSPCLAAATTTGSPRYFRFTSTDQSHRSTDVLSASSLYFVDAHLESDATLTPDDFPTEDASEDHDFLVRGDGAGGDASDTIHHWCHVKGVRLDTDIDTSNSALTQTIRDPTSTTRATRSTGTDANGWPPTPQTLLASTPLGSWTALCSVAFNGNTGSDTESFTVGVEAGPAALHVGDPLKVFAVYDPIVDRIRIIASESYLDGTARTGNAAGTFVRILDADNTLVVTDANPAEISHGGYRYDYTPTEEGIFTVLVRTTDPDSGDPVGTLNAVLVAPGYNSTNDESILEALMHETAFAELTGFTGPEFIAILAATVAGVILWLRSKDSGIRAFGSALCMLAGALAILLTLRVGVSLVWAGALSFGAMLFIVGCYMLIRLFLDEFLGTGEP